jgi:hypothetical protein
MGVWWFAESRTERKSRHVHRNEESAQKKEMDVPRLQNAVKGQSHSDTHGLTGGCVFWKQTAAANIQASKSTTP